MAVLCSNSELINRILGGDGTAFDVLVESYRASVYRQALGRVDHPQDAEEVTQNVFLKVYLNLCDLRDGESFEAWLRTITMRESGLCIRGRHVEREGPSERLERERDTGLTPEQAVLQTELRNRIRQAIRSLPEHERKVARAFYLEDHSYREIQERFGLTHSTVAGYLYRARRRLAERLDGLLSFIWLPGWETLWPAVSNPEAAHATKAAVVATVATVALVAGTVPSHRRAVEPMRVGVSMQESPQSHTIRHKALTAATVVGDPGFGIGVVHAAELPKRSSVHVVASRIEKGSRRARFFRGNGDLTEKVRSDGDKAKKTKKGIEADFENFDGPETATKDLPERAMERALSHQQRQEKRMLVRQQRNWDRALARAFARQQRNSERAAERAFTEDHVKSDADVRTQKNSDEKEADDKSGKYFSSDGHSYSLQAALNVENGSL
jgi:RNA polymerase sigma-70 factor (ECF subfamily)